MKRVFLILFLFPLLIHSQSRYEDSLSSYRYKALYKSTIYGEKVSAKQAIDSLKSIAAMKRYPEAAFHYHFLSGDYYFNLHQLPASERHYDQALQIAEDLQLAPNIVQCMLWLGNMDYLRTKYSDAAQWYNKAYALSEKSAYNEGMCNALYGLAEMEKDYYKKMETYIHIESLYAQHNEISPVLSNTLEKMGKLHLNTLNDRKTATEYFEKSLSISRRTDYPYGINEVTKLLGEMAVNEGNYEQASIYFEDLYRENLKRKDTLNQMHALVQLAEIDRRTEHYIEAENKLLKAIDHYSKKNDITAQTAARLLLARVYIEMQKPGLAKQHLNYANNHYQSSMDTVSFKINLLTAETDYYVLLQNFEEALNKSKEIDYLKTIQNRLNNEQQFLILETQYRTRQKEDQIELLSAEKFLAEQQRKNQFTFFAVTTILLLVIGLALLFSYRNKLKAARKIKELNEMKSRFFANISHEFRTPLTLIISPLQSLQTGLSDKQQQKQLSRIEKNADRMLELVDQLLELSKIDSGNLRLILKKGNLSQFLKSVVEPFEYRAKEQGLLFCYEVENKAVDNYYDKDVIEKIVSNLLANALKYTPQDHNVNFSASIEQENVKLSISNAGCGLMPSDVPRLFERFYQKNDKQQGFGIGLALIKELVDLYKGKLETTLDKDVLRFDITLPLDQQKTETVIIHTNTITGTMSGEAIESGSDRPVLLLVDDNTEIRHILKDIFTEKYIVLEADNGKTALQTAREQIPDCIISDVMMPEMDGFRFTKAIKCNELTSFIPVILLTAKTSDETHLESLKSTADAFITKPFNHKILEETVNCQIAERKKLRERYSRELTLQPMNIAINSIDEKFIEKLQVVLKEHLSDTGFSTDHFASALCMSRMQLHRKLKSLFNVSTTEFIRNERLKAAAELIKKGNRHISEIAYTTGFNDLSYFSKCFKELYRITPSEFIHNNQPIKKQQIVLEEHASPVPTRSM